MGGRFTVADLNVATVMDLAPQCGIALDAWPHVQQWHARCLAPSWSCAVWLWLGMPSATPSCSGSWRLS
ncbi:MAG: glutathione binding-like protein [Thermoflexus sp.]